MKEKTETRLRADELGIRYHHNANDVTIQKLIDAHIEANPEPAADDYRALHPDLPFDDCEPMTEAEFKEKYAPKKGDKRKKCAALVRCRIQNMNPAKKEWPGEIVSVGSAKLGTWKKYIPFNSSEPYHIPKIIYDMLLEKKCTIFHTEKDERGNSVRKGRLVNEYALEVLPPLTPEELKELARQQALEAN
jgi:hypothetical protein